jgi:putative polymerase
MGYPYLLSRNGLVAVLALWAAWWLMDIASPVGRRFRALAALYVALILCVSGSSFFAFKTSALLGFLLGCRAAAFPSPSGAEAERCGGAPAEKRQA